MKPFLFVLMLAVAVYGQTTPVPILKQINSVNDDGSYTYGFEAADGSFKVETRDPFGIVKGKYGYVDDNGQLQVIEYVAGETTGPEIVMEDMMIDVTTRPVRPRTTTPMPIRQTTTTTTMATPIVVQSPTARRTVVVKETKINPNRNVPILKQINRVNDDGSYTYGFEAADGTFKVETRDNLGNVKGKYGYVDETGALKVVEYAAGLPGFEATGEHLPVPSVPVRPAVPRMTTTTTTTTRPAVRQPIAVQQQPTRTITPQQMNTIEQHSSHIASNNVPRGFSFAIEAPVFQPVTRPL